VNLSIQQFLFIGLVILSSVFQSKAASVTFSDSDFSPVWQATTVASPFSFGGEDATATRSFIGPNPSSASADYIEVGLTTAFDGGTVEAFVFDGAFVFDPAGSAMVTTIDFSATMRDTLGEISFAIEQGGNYYLPASYTPNLSGGWGNRSASFPEVAFTRFANSSGGPLRPDFSATGAPITVGMYGRYENFLDFMQDFGFVEFDNFSATVQFTPIPEPGGGVLACVGLIGLLARRRR